ncbi:MAG: hypothetical protein R3314_08415 [Longimicrobiales bacterium]|nr:hypothetical protein [Longimicrobiales bacterium]
MDPRAVFERRVRRAVVPGLAALAGLTLTAGMAAAQGAGSEASTLLRLAPGARPLALGHAFVAVRDPLALEYNPAATAVGGITAGYQDLPVGASAGSSTVTFLAGPATLGVSLRFLNYGEVAVYEPTGVGPVGTPTGLTATGGELSALVGGGVRLGPARLGLAARWLHLDVAGLADDAFVGDAGALLEPVRGLTLGVSYQGFGGDVEAGRAAPLLRTLRVGAAVERWYGERLKAILTVEGRRREARIGGGFGLEIRGGTERLEAALRAGYEIKPDPDDAYSAFVFGGGVRLDRLTVELAYRALGPLGSTRLVGLRYRF